jgi:hypothetical protein
MLQELATGLKQELAEKLMDMDVVKFSMHPVKVFHPDCLNAQFLCVLL